jgi:D-alanyl-D-alanine carboxypeptidase
VIASLRLAYILEKAYQKPFSTILAEKIVEPLGLKNTSIGKKINAQNNESFSYKLTNTWEIEKETDMSIPMGAGAVISTPADLTRFAEALFNGKIISTDSLATMITIKDNYGMGIFQMPFYNKQGFGHSGGIDGFTSVFSYFPEDKIAYALTSNGSSYTINNISLAVLSSVYNKPFDIPDFNAISLTSDELNPYLGIYSSNQMPLKITITKNGNTLVAQATGQSSFELNATEKHIFKFDQAGIVLIFNPEKKQMTLKQGGGIFEFTRDN